MKNDYELQNEFVSARTRFIQAHFTRLNDMQKKADEEINRYLQSINSRSDDEQENIEVARLFYTPVAHDMLRRE